VSTVGGVTLIGTIAGYVCVGMLLVAGTHHLIRRAPFVDQLRAQLGWTRTAATSLALVVAVLEIAIGGTGAFALSTAPGSGELLRAALVLAAGQFLVYGLYLRWLMSTVDGPVPCACHSTPVPASGWTVGRTIALAILGGIACGTAGSVVAPLDPAGLPAVVVSVPIGIALWILPEALATRPTPSIPPRVVQQ